MISLHDQPGGGMAQDPAPKPDVSLVSSPQSPVDTANHFLVGDNGSEISFMPFANIVRCRISRPQAINLAAWLAVLADPDGKEFERVLREIRKT